MATSRRLSVVVNKLNTIKIEFNEITVGGGE